MVHFPLVFKTGNESINWKIVAKCGDAGVKRRWFTKALAALGVLMIIG
jgi:hypothetical protein